MSASPFSLEELLEAVVKKFTTNPRLGERIRGKPGPPGPSGVANGLLDNRWRIEEFGLFEPDLRVDAAHPAGDIVTIGRDTIYRNVDAFCERIQDVAATRGPEVVRDNLHLCLRGTASRWWTFELNDINKQAIRDDPTSRLSQWTIRLIARFSHSPNSYSNYF